jgi:hypothetical protein
LKSCIANNDSEEKKYVSDKKYANDLVTVLPEPQEVIHKYACFKFFIRFHDDFIKSVK